MMGLVLERPFPTYPDGFPPEVIEPFEAGIGRGILCNRPASGTAIIDELGDEHVRTGRPIVYTSADSVFQIACHEEVVPVPELYEWCELARGILQGEHAVGRVIARPFLGSSGAYERTPHRRDYSLPPTGPTYLDLLHERGVPVVGVGKIGEIFTQRGIDVDDHTTNNTDGDRGLPPSPGGDGGRPALRQPRRLRPGLGPPQRRRGLRGGLAQVDAAVPEFERRLRPGDALVLCADHGVDPTTASTDHSREYSPLLAPRPAAGTLGRRPGGRGRDGLLAADRRGAGPGRTGDPLSGAWG